MALPQLNDSPKYELVIPSTQQKVRFRPFLVKEEKVMMMAMESENQKDILNTIVDTIETCIIDNIDASKLTTFDVEYSFLQIRAKSVGEHVHLNLKCEHCEKLNEVSVKLDDIKVDVPSINNIIDITDKISVEMRWPSYKQVISNDILQEETSVDQIFALIRSSISAIMSEEERFSTSDYSKEDLDKFIESMNSVQFAKIQNYVESMPSLSHDVKFKCTSCSSDNLITVQGMQSFFS